MLNSHLLRVAALSALVSLCPLSVAAAQDEAPAYTATTIQDLAIDLQDLEWDLGVLRRAELEVELEAWFAVVQAKTREGVALLKELKADQSASAEDKVARENAMRAEHSALVERMGKVVEVAEKRGVDVEEASQYLGTLGEQSRDDKSVEEQVHHVKDWVTSPEGGIAVLLNIVKFLAVLLVFKMFGGIVAKILGRAVKRMPHSSDLLYSFVVNTSRKLIFFIGVVIALSYIGVNIAPLVAALGAAGFIIGFALQGTLGNFAAGVMVLIYRPFDVGDVVTAAGVTGKVDSMNLVSTTVKTPDNQKIIVPNGTIWGDVITNITAENTRRVDLVFGCGYDDDLDKVKAVLREVAEAHPKVNKDPAVTVEVTELADSSVNFVCRPWCSTDDYWDVYWDLQMQMKQRFDKEGISIPFPQQDVYMHEVKAD